jgi:hypothetical protein
MNILFFIGFIIFLVATSKIAVTMFKMVCYLFNNNIQQSNSEKIKLFQNKLDNLTNKLV